MIKIVLFAASCLASIWLTIFLMCYPPGFGIIHPATIATYYLLIIVSCLSALTFFFATGLSLEGNNSGNDHLLY